MKDVMLRGAIAIDNTRKRALDIYANRKENGDIVQVIIIIAMFVLVCVVVGKILYDAITTQASTVSDCITKANEGSCTDFQKP